MVTLKRIRRSMRADHNGTRSTLLLHLVVYRGTGLVSLNHLRVEGLLGANEVIAQTLNEFRKQIEKEERRWTRKSRRG
jgi:hypothetical protein